MKRFLVLAMIGLAMAPGAAMAQQDAAARIDAARRSAADAGIPVSLLDSRVAEGRAKGIPLDRIAAVVERRAAALTQARQAMSAAPGLTSSDLSAGADALEAGLGGNALRAVIQGARAEDRPVAIAVLTFLHQQGVPVDQAVARVREAVARGPEALRTLPSQATGRERRGPPEGVGRPTGVGGGPPASVPAPGKKPGAGKPDNPGRGNQGGNRPGGGS